jgi:hypothetical protein
MRSTILIIPTFFIATLVFVVFGLLGLCGMSDCLGSGNASTKQTLLSAAFVVAASLPLIACLTVLIADYRRRPLGTLARTIVWTVILVAGAFGVFQVLVDPGDAVWAGLPLIAFSTLFAAYMKTASSQ